ncbi:MAG: response regulator [Psychroflexus sp.]|nr:response regulator [Psychroflexus sp.]
MEMNVLIIDDHPAQVDAYASIFELANDSVEFTFHKYSSLKDAYEFAIDNEEAQDVDFALLDLNMPAYKELDLYSGADLAFIFQRQMPHTELCFITSHNEALILFDLYQEFQPAGILVKTDFDGAQLEAHFQDILNGRQTFSPTFLKAWEIISSSDILLDCPNRKIIKKLAEGYPSKDLPEMIGLSMSAIDKRKASLKSYFNTDHKKDNYLVLKAKDQGLI